MNIKFLKGQRTKLLKSNPEDMKQFEEVQNKLDEVELRLMLAENINHIPVID